MLGHYRVLDLTDERGQLAGHIFRSLGAEVILVEPPGGSSARTVGPFVADEPGPERSLTFWAHNRGKKSVVLDLDTGAGRERFIDLVRGADVLVENQPLGALAARGLGRDVLESANEALVHISVTPFGQSGPKANWASSDLTLLAASGGLVLTGDKDRPPVRFGPPPQAWHHGAAEAVQAGLIALYERDNRSGLGQHADVSVQQAANQVAGSQMLAFPLEASLSRRMAGGIVYGGIDVKLMWPCADGFVSVTFLFGAGMGPFTRRLMEWVHEEGFCDEETRDKNWTEYGTFLLDGQEPLSEYERVRDQVLTAFFASKTKDELFRQALKRRLLIAPVATAADVLANEQLSARGYWETVQMGDAGPVKFPGAIAKLEKTPLEPVPGPPMLGEHTNEVCGEKRHRIAAVTSDRVVATSGEPPLAGLRVLDLMWVMAGPAASRVLADYGADVIRVESSHRIDTARTLAPHVGNEGHPEKSAVFNNLNSNKRDLAIDLSERMGRNVMFDLVRWADVVLDSFSPHGMPALGLDYDTLRNIKPELIVASSCLSGHTGPLSALAGFGTMASALSGFFYICGWPDRPPCGPFGAYTDTVSPRYFLCTVLAALEHRRRTGEGQYIDFSQSESSIHNLSSILLDCVVNGRIAERMGNDDQRFSPHGVYPADGNDSWIAVVCETDQQWRALCAALGPDADRLAVWTTADRLARRRELDELIARWTTTRSAHAATELLQAAGVPAHAVVNSEEAFADTQLRHRNHFVKVPHGNLGATWVEGTRFILSRTPARVWRAGPTYGEDTFDILSRTLGYDTDRIAEIAATGILE